MKAKMLILVLAIFGSSLIFAQESKQETTNDCEKKVLKQIRRNMDKVKITDFVAEGKQIRVLVTCKINEKKEVEAVSVEGYNSGLNEAIIRNLDEYPVKCNTKEAGDTFSFWMTFKHIS